MQSMTGYGNTEADSGLYNITVEARSLNSKNIEIAIRVPQSLRRIDQSFRGFLTKELIRGKVEVSVNLNYTEGVLPATINEELAGQYYAQIDRLAETLNQDRTNLLPVVLKMPEVISSESIHAPDDALIEQITRMLKASVVQLKAFRAQEGAALHQDICEHIRQIREKLSAVDVLDPERAINTRERLTKHLNSLEVSDSVDQNRFEQELIYYLEKMDVSEEKIRLANHLEYFEEIAGTEGAIGRKLAFIAQEMGREINTLGAKANHSGIQRIVVEMKDELEKIKEQVLNVL